MQVFAFVGQVSNEAVSSATPRKTPPSAQNLRPAALPEVTQSPSHRLSGGRVTGIEARNIGFFCIKRLAIGV